MHNFDTLLFDIDNTILDFDADEDQALQKLFSLTPIELTPAIKENYSKFNQQLWQQLERGEISRDELFAKRFNTFFMDQFNLDVHELNLTEKYISFLSEGHDPIEHAPQLIADLVQQNIRLEVATNGVAQTQIKRLTDSNLITKFDQLFISEQIGASKPQVAFFDYVENHLDNYSKAHTLMIGDSLTSDIQGGINAGIKTVWFNPHHLTNSTNFSPTYEIDDLLQIEEII